MINILFLQGMHNTSPRGRLHISNNYPKIGRPKRHRSKLKFSQDAFYFFGGL